mmetsp:Transcript_32835/g.68525  ORF Transcript_32835/g.68525 Transcript_32835/m.68525 type:complete len:294 (-) Transcript_32835:1465-2346(-)
MLFLFLRLRSCSHETLRDSSSCKKTPSSSRSAFCAVLGLREPEEGRELPPLRASPAGVRGEGSSVATPESPPVADSAGKVTAETEKFGSCPSGIGSGVRDAYKPLAPSLEGEVSTPEAERALRIVRSRCRDGTFSCSLAPWVRFSLAAISSFAFLTMSRSSSFFFAMTACTVSSKAPPSSLRLYSLRRCEYISLDMASFSCHRVLLCSSRLSKCIWQFACTSWMELILVLAFSAMRRNWRASSSARFSSYAARFATISSSVLISAFNLRDVAVSFRAFQISLRLTALSDFPLL